MSDIERDDHDTEDALQLAYREAEADAPWMRGATSFLCKIKRLMSCGYTEVTPIDRVGAGSPGNWTRFKCRRKDGATVVRRIRRGPGGWEIGADQ